MDLVRYDRNNEKTILKRDASKADFMALMERAKKKFGVKAENPHGLSWPNAHKNIFYANGLKFALEFLPEFDFFDNNQEA